jgi:hypothetical protein
MTANKRVLVKKIIPIEKAGLRDPAAANHQGTMDVLTRLQQVLADLEAQIARAPQPTYSTGTIQDRRTIHDPLTLSREGPWNLDQLDLWVARRAATAALFKNAGGSREFGPGSLGITEESERRGNRVAKASGRVPSDSWVGTQNVAEQMMERQRAYAAEAPSPLRRPGLRVKR